MKLKARPHLHYAPLPDGVYFGGPRTQFVMRGSDLLFTVADACMPLLEVGATEDELVAAVGSEHARPAVRHLVTGLRGKSMLLDLGALSMPEPPDHVRSRHAESLAYLESACADPYATFARLRAAKVALFGPPEAVRPAARGLSRAGVGRLVFPVSDDGSYEDVDAALCCFGPGIPEHAGWLPAGIPVVPVQFDGQLIVVGPVVRDEAGQQLRSALQHRVLAWAQAEHTEPPARPVAGALAGALAGQLLFEVLTGLATDGEVHLVHGAELITERLIVTAGARTDDRWHLLDDAGAGPAPTPREAVAWAGVITRRWTGLFSSAAGQDLPQLPCALREIGPRANTGGPVIAWAPEQESATVGVALEGLRRSCSGAGPGAAGLTEERWLLDGALRLLVDQAQPLCGVPAQDLDPEALRIWQSLKRLGADPVTIALLQVPGLSWRLGRVASAATGVTFGLGWGPDAGAAVGDALATTLARAQVARLTGDEHAVAVLRTDALMSADGPTIEFLRKQVSVLAGAQNMSYRGRSRRADPLLGEIAFWYGSVQVCPLTPGRQHAY